MTTHIWYGNDLTMTLRMSLQDAHYASHQGVCDDDVRALSQTAHIRSQLDALDRDALNRELKAYGAWSDEERADHEQNLQRILWIAAGAIVEDPTGTED